jgi:hypothetical protein
LIYNCKRKQRIDQSLSAVLHDIPKSDPIKNKMVFDFSKIGGDEEDRTLDLTDANELKALICIDFQTFPALSAGM